MRMISSSLPLMLVAARPLRNDAFVVTAPRIVRQFHTNNNNNHNMMLRAFSTSQSSATTTTPLFPEELNVIYDSKCNVCKLEIDFLARRDEKLHATNRKLKMTDIEDANYDPSSPVNGYVSYKDGMAAIHAIRSSDGKVLKGVPVFKAAYECVDLGWLFVVTEWPVFRSLINVGYDIFAKYRTNITRGSSLDDLVKSYEEKKALEMNKMADCETCPTPVSSSSSRP
mmetsp:Transcript_15130/g.42663  ORF Transcript_15130/g.42663 Transcript_15130/m.42663 type:complete len:226 (-) Transcript_15130:87-764(-)|eukprot:CAMPEP_0119568138 /NCGR_PEP_ID=MMETSP1352-20130426/38004_1 /TAXON_ID=265584 /ORGANISM="Stauroneis constricta, Strain CCMP1120" /LENGTH=225 /DNA_ID=CAMNT_0007617485 /DNA_START=43 /DNA_END=720 /DNA_ORIENTATION=+